MTPVVMYGVAPSAPYDLSKIEPIKDLDSDFFTAPKDFDPLMLLVCRGLTTGQFAAGWYAVNALAATLALVPEERVVWVVKSGGEYLTDPEDVCWSVSQSEAWIFGTLAEAQECCGHDCRPVRLRIRRRS